MEHLPALLAPQATTTMLPRVCARNALKELTQRILDLLLAQHVLLGHHLEPDLAHAVFALRDTSALSQEAAALNAANIHTLPSKALPSAHLVPLDQHLQRRGLLAPYVPWDHTMLKHAVIARNALRDSTLRILALCHVTRALPARQPLSAEVFAPFVLLGTITMHRAVRAKYVLQAPHPRQVLHRVSKGKFEEFQPKRTGIKGSGSTILLDH
jgi:hypothetical protein